MEKKQNGKKGNAEPVCKEGGQQYRKNYRPVFFLSVLS